MYGPHFHTLLTHAVIICKILKICTITDIPTEQLGSADIEDEVLYD